MKVLLAQPRGFCAGVVRAIDIVERALERHGAPVYVFHEIVHNGHVVAELRDRGAVFVERIADIPRGAPTVFSAHGVSRAVLAESLARGLEIVDATCPLVAKVHAQAQRFVREGRTLIVIGHAGHDEVEGTVGSVDAPVHLVASVADIAALPFDADQPLAYVTQTTLSLDETRALIDALRQRFGNLAGPDLDDICYATQNRQVAVRMLARQAELLIIVGSRRSSNAARLREVGESQRRRAYLVEDAGDLDPAWLQGVERIGVSAGASTPERLVQQVCERLRALGASEVRSLEGVRESMSFRLPAPLWARAA